MSQIVTGFLTVLHAMPCPGLFRLGQSELPHALAFLAPVSFTETDEIAVRRKNGEHFFKVRLR
jgi:hypothetical protein